DHRQSCPHGALRVVLVRQRVAKVDEQTISQVLGNVPTEALDDRSTGRLVRTHRSTVVFRVEVPGQRRRGHRITEQDGELAAFRLWRRGCTGGGDHLWQRRCLHGRRGRGGRRG